MVHQKVRHLAYAGGRKKLEPLWDLIIRARRVSSMLPLPESTSTRIDLRPVRIANCRPGPEREQILMLAAEPVVDREELKVGSRSLRPARQIRRS
jgi:hypothetical protein